MAHAQTPDTSISLRDGLNNTSDATNARFGADDSWKFDPITPRLHYGPPDKHLSLPSLDVCRPRLTASVMFSSILTRPGNYAHDRSLFQLYQPIDSSFQSIILHEDGRQVV